MMGLLILLAILLALYIVIIKPFLKGYREKEPNITIEIVEDEEETPYEPTTTQVSAKLSPELYKKLQKYCDTKNISKTSVIKESIELYFQNKEFI